MVHIWSTPWITRCRLVAQAWSACCEHDLAREPSSPLNCVLGLLKLFLVVVGPSLIFASSGLGNFLPAWMLEPFDPNDKSNLARYRIVHLIALAIVGHALLACGVTGSAMALVDAADEMRSTLLQVFCIGIVLSFCVHAAIESLNSVWVQIFVGATGILPMTMGAYYCWTWCKQRARMLPSHARLGDLA